MKLLDLFCGAGGAAMGYHCAGFDDITGVDIAPQKHYPFRFIQADALEYLRAVVDGRVCPNCARICESDHNSFRCDHCSRLWPLGMGWAMDFDAIHASPPCQAYTALKTMWNSREHPDLIAPTRELLQAIGMPYVMENVPGAPMENTIMLCGSMFRLGTDIAELRHHRLFEIEPPMLLTLQCSHNWKAHNTIGVFGQAGGQSNRDRAAVIGVYGGHGRDRRRRMNGQNFPTSDRAQAMGIDWMTGAELCQAIPPAYTEFIGRQWLVALKAIGRNT